MRKQIEIYTKGKTTHLVKYYTQVNGYVNIFLNPIKPVYSNDITNSTERDLILSFKPCLISDRSK